MKNSNKKITKVDVTINKTKFTVFKTYINKLYNFNRLKYLSDRDRIDNYLKNVRKQNYDNNIRKFIETLVYNFRLTIVILKLSYDRLLDSQNMLIRNNDNYINSLKYRVVHSVICGHDDIFKKMEKHIKCFILNLTN